MGVVVLYVGNSFLIADLYTFYNPEHLDNPAPIGSLL